MPIQQLRIYQIDETRREAFRQRFADHAVRIMASYGFHILAMWESKSEDGLEFVYLLDWPDRESLDRQWALFMADEEWAQVKRDVRSAVGGEPVLNVTSRVLEIVPYSPPLVPVDRVVPQEGGPA